MGRKYEIRKDGQYLFGVWDVANNWWYAKDLLRTEAKKKLVHAVKIYRRDCAQADHLKTAKTSPISKPRSDAQKLVVTVVYEVESEKAYLESHPHAICQKGFRVLKIKYGDAIDGREKHAPLLAKESDA
jgi:hypothetical protein